MVMTQRHRVCPPEHRQLHGAALLYAYIMNSGAKAIQPRPLPMPLEERMMHGAACPFMSPRLDSTKPMGTNRCDHTHQEDGVLVLASQAGAAGLVCSAAQQ